MYLISKPVDISWWNCSCHSVLWTSTFWA